MLRPKVEKMKGRAFKFGDNISTDHIAPGRLFHLRSDLQEFAKHVLEDADENFAKEMKKGDFVVAGNNFGLGSSREHAPQIIKIAGVGAVIAKSFARIFYRNAINIGLVIIENSEIQNDIEKDDKIEIDIQNGEIINITKNKKYSFPAFPKEIQKLINAGGLVEYTKEKMVK